MRAFPDLRHKKIQEITIKQH